MLSESPDSGHGSAPAENPPTRNDDRLAWRALQMIFAQNGPATAGGAACFVMVCIAFWYVVPGWVLIGWAIAYGLVVSYRYLRMAEYARTRTRGPEKLESWLTRMDRMQLMTGALWGALLAHLTMIGNAGQLVVVTILMTGLVTGGLLAYSSREKTFVLFSSAMSLPVMAGMLARPEPLYFAAALVGLWFVFLKSCAGKFSEFYLHSVTLSLENKDLARDLEQRNAQVTELNAALEEKVQQLGEANERLLEEQDRIVAFASELDRLSTTDSLTGIPNRRRFELVLERTWDKAIRHRQPIALILLDIDHFKPFNDHYGHRSGDDCLTRVAQILVATAGPDATVARYGGEEFVVILADTGLKQASDVSHALVQAVTDAGIPHEASGTGLPHVTVSAGLAVHRPTYSCSSAELIENADAALYQAKDRGRNQVASAQTAGRISLDPPKQIELDDGWPGDYRRRAEGKPR